jgi:hypothetical protein
MQMFPVAGKRKSADLCEAFMRGAKGADHCAVFYGVDESNLADFQRIRKSGLDWYYIDNSYFDKTRGSHYRVTKNGLQHSGTGATNGSRFRLMRTPVMPWRANGSHVVICPQSDSFMQSVIHHNGPWLDKAIARLRGVTSRPIVVREWDRDKLALASTLASDLRNAWILVTHSSAAAVSALLSGIPVISESGAAALMSSSYETIETPFMPQDRERFFGVLADNQWTPAEMASGQAWKEIGK